MIWVLAHSLEFDKDLHLEIKEIVGTWRGGRLVRYV